MQQGRWRGCGICDFSIENVFRCQNYMNALRIAVFYYMSAPVGELYIPNTGT